MHAVEIGFVRAVDAGVKDLKSAGEEGKRRLVENSEKTLLFVDEIHRFNKTQQDILLPYIEKGFLYVESGPLVRSSYHAEKHVL